jgi:Leucine-rich repeat (LRR) protein
LLNLAQSNGASPDGSLRPAALLAWQLAALRPSLRSLSLAGCALAVPALSGLSELRSLQELDLTGCSLADSHLSPLDALTALTALILDNNQSVTLEVTAPLEQDGTPSSRSGGEGMQREQEEGVTAWPDIWRQDGPPPQANGRGALSGSPVPGGQASPSVADGSGHHGLGLPHLAYLSCRRTGVTDAGLQLLLGGSAGARAAAAGPEPPGQSPLQCILLGSPGVTDEGLLALSQLAPGLRAITLQVGGEASGLASCHA